MRSAGSRPEHDENDELSDGSREFEFLNELTKKQSSDVSKTVRDMITRGRVLLAVESYKSGQASLGRAA
jgi:hypothetical protein